MSSSDYCLSGAILFIWSYICLALTSVYLELYMSSSVYLELYMSSSDYCLSGAIYV